MPRLVRDFECHRWNFGPGDDPVTFFVKKKALGSDRMSVVAFSTDSRSLWRGAIETMVVRWEGVTEGGGTNPDGSERRVRPVNFSWEALCALTGTPGYEDLVLDLGQRIIEETDVLRDQKDALQKKTTSPTSSNGASGAETPVRSTEPSRTA